MKAILELDMPKSCHECVLTYYSEWPEGTFCAVTGDMVTDEKYKYCRYENCPLKAVGE